MSQAAICALLAIPLKTHVHVMGLTAPMPYALELRVRLVGTCTTAASVVVVAMDAVWAKFAPVTA